MSLKNLFKKEKKQPPVGTKPVSASKPARPADKSATPVKAVKAEKKTDSSAKVKPSGAGSIISHRVLLKPLTTEKGAHLTEAGKYVFMVDSQANKIIIAQAVAETYGVKVKQVNVLNFKGKRVRYGRRRGQRKDWKKAIVTLVKGETIEIYKGV